MKARQIFSILAGVPGINASRAIPVSTSEWQPAILSKREGGSQGAFYVLVVRARKDTHGMSEGNEEIKPALTESW